MADENMKDRRPSGSGSRSRTKGISLYASTADYERRLSEDCTQPPEPDVSDETQAGDA